MKPGRNHPCPCGSGRKYKQCCGETRAPAAASPPHTQASVDQAYQAALGHFRLRSLGTAEALLRQVVEVAPGHADALKFLGIIAHQTDRNRLAVEYLTRALKLRPDDAKIRYNLGVVLHTLGRLHEAEPHYRHAVRLNPDYALAQSNLGNVLHARNCSAEAVRHHRRAVELEPGNASFIANLGTALQATGDHEAAKECYRRALAINPDQVQARYFLDALEHTDAPVAMPAELVTRLFDLYAENFDHHLVNVLQYRTPKVLYELFEQATEANGLEVLDLGCGTGLAGEAFRQRAKRMVGVDLSRHMVEKARQRGIYAEAKVTDVLSALREAPCGYDLVLAADVFVYLGDLIEVFTACARALRPGGWFVFSTETGQDKDFEVFPSGRFKHATGYIRRLAGAAGFEEVAHRQSALRLEEQVPVVGDLFVLRWNGSLPA